MPEKEYIERDDLIKNLNTLAPEYYNALINELIMKQPAADVVKVVRCKDCKYYPFCCRTIRTDGNRPDDFCSYGKRKDG